MDNIIFEDPSKRVSRKDKVGSNIALPTTRYDVAIEQAPEPIDPYFSHDTNFDVHIHGKEPVSLYDMFSLSGDEELGNEDLINRPPEVSSPGNINGPQELSISISREPAEDVIPIDPAILGKESVSEENVDENIVLDLSGSSYPTSPKSLALHGHAQIIEDSAPASDANSDTQRLPSKRRLSDETNHHTPRKRCRKDSLSPKDQQRTLYSCFSAAPLHERLDFLAWLLKTGLSESLSAASVELPFARVKTTDRRIAPARSQHRRPQAARNRTCPTSTESRKGKPWEPDEIKLLVQLKKDGLSWSAIARRFEERFPGRSQGTIQVYWSKNMKYLH
uniref:Aspartyl/glutamyl-tRNA(Asn/Gln) amidotransferase subunit B n=1 Tax=Talaromyces marneffei PM1 TaxID=1077442 RepID=A0A093VG08_TALMA